MSGIKNLWRLERGEEEAYLWGTMHYSPVSYREAISLYLRMCSRLVTELDLGSFDDLEVDETVPDEEILTFHDSMPENARVMFVERLGPDEYEKFASLPAVIGALVAQANYINNVLGFRESMDGDVIAAANEYGIPVTGLETWKEQLDTASGDEKTTPEDYWDTYEERMKIFPKLFDLYQREDIATIRTVLQDDSPKFAVPEREERLYTRSLEIIEREKPFIAIGVSHLPPFLEKAQRDSFETVKISD